MRDQQFRFYVVIRGRPAEWVVSIVFMLVGAIVAFFLPAIVRPSADRDTAVTLIRVVGGVFLGLGTLIFLWMVGDLYFKFRHPEYRETWYWWGNFVGPLVAAGLFAVPATLALPLMALAYALRPNAFFPPNSPDAANNLVVGAIFSAVGLLCLALMGLVGRSMYRKRPRRHHLKS
jgi:hypothetical protein